MVSDLLREGVREPSEAPHSHPHIEVLTLHVARADVRHVGRSDNANVFRAKTSRRAVTLLPLRIATVNLDQLSVVDILRKGVRNGSQIHLMAVRRQLNSIRQAALNILKELRCTPGVPPSNHPAYNELRLRFYGRERPDIPAMSLCQLSGGDVLFFASNETPNLVNLNTLCRNVADNSVLILSTGRADFHEQIEDGMSSNTRHALRRTDRATLNERRDDRNFLFHAQRVHEPSILQRFSMSTRKDGSAREK